MNGIVGLDYAAVEQMARLFELELTPTNDQNPDT